MNNSIFYYACALNVCSPFLAVVVLFLPLFSVNKELHAQ